MNKTMIIMRGLPGSGKSTLAKTLAPAESIYSADEFWQKNGKYSFEFKYLRYAHAWNQARVARALFTEESLVVIDNTNITIKEIEPYISLAKEFGYEYYTQEPISPWWLEMAPRIKNKTFTDEDAQILFERNTHNVPFGILRNRMAAWQNYES